MTAAKAGLTMFGAVVAGRALTAVVNMLVAKLPASVQGPLSKVGPVAVPALALVGGHFLTKKGPLARYRTWIMMGLGFNLAEALVKWGLSFAPSSPALDVWKQRLALGDVTPAWGYIDNPYRYTSGMGRYVEAPMGQLYEAPAGMGAYVPSPQPHALSEYVQTPASGMGVYEAATIQMSGPPSGIFSQAIFGLPPGTAGVAAFEG